MVVINKRFIALLLAFLLFFSHVSLAMNVNIESSINDAKIYPYQQIVQKVKIITDENFTYNVSLNEAEQYIYKLDKGRVNKNAEAAYSANFSVFLYPKNSGEQLLPKINISVIGGDGKLYNLENIPQEISVKTIEDAYNGLPIADNIEILSGQQPDAGEVYLGEPIKRTIVIKAHNLTSELINSVNTEIKVGADELKQYDGSSSNSNIINNNDLYGVRSVTVFYIARKKGELILPELNYKWFSSKDNKIHVSKSKEIKYQIIEPPKTSDRFIDKLIAELNTPDSIYRLVASVIFVLVMLISRYQRKHKSKQQAINKMVSMMRYACNNYDAKKAEEAVIMASDLIFNTYSKDINQIAKITTNQDFIESCSELSAFIYGGTGGWNAETMFTSFKYICKNNKKPKIKEKEYNPEELYPY